MSDGQQPAVTDALARLRGAADTVRAGWLPQNWTRVSGPGPASQEMSRRQLQDQPYGVFRDLVLEPGCTLALRADLEVPTVIAGVPTLDDSLELTVNSLYPIHAEVGGTTVLDASGVPAAAGPALVTLLPELPAPGSELTLTIETPSNRVFSINPDYVPPWVWLHFTTPRLRARFEQLDIGWARLFLATSVATSHSERAAVEAAAAVIPADPLAMTDDDLGRVAEILRPLSPAIEQLHVHLVGHSHIDLAWLWRWSDAANVAERDLATVLELMRDFPEMRFTHSQPVTYEVLRERKPELFAEICERVREGRWEPATCQWVESDTNLLSGEAMARQLLEGVTWTREHLGTSPRVFLAPDTFGHAGTLPQLAASAGARAYYHHRCIPGEGDDRWPAYWWEGDDGSRVLGVTSPAYYGHITAHEVAEAAVRSHKAGHRNALKFYGVCDHGGGPTRQSLETLARLQGVEGMPRLACSTVAGYADALLAEEPELPVHRGESALTFTGCYTSHGDSKTMNRQGEAALITADTVAAMAGSGGAPIEAWRDVLFQQFHDILDGSSIAEVYDDQREASERAVAAAEEARDAALATLHRLAPVRTVAVTNPHGWTRTDVASVPLAFLPDDVTFLVGPEGEEVPVQRSAGHARFVAEVRPFATAAFSTAPTKAGAPDLEVNESSDGLRVEGLPFGAVVDPSGLHISAPDGTGRLWLNRLEVVDEKPVPMAAWVLGAIDNSSLVAASNVKVIDAGPVSVTVALRYEVRDSTIEEELTLYRDLPRVDAVFRIDWRERGGPDVGVPGLMLRCDMAAETDAAWFEAPFGATRRPADGREVPGLGWASVEDREGKGVAILNDGRHGYSATDGSIRLHLVRSPYEPDPVADRALHEIRVSYVPFSAGWRSAHLARAALAHLAPLLSGAGAGTGTVPGHPNTAPGRAWTVGHDDSVVVSGLKPARRGDGVVLRAYEAHGEGGRLHLKGLPTGASVHRANLVEDRLDRLSYDAGTVAVDLRPFEVVTLLIDGGERP